ncbi:MAG TPA: winged helix-turn-helix domain-containing protein [Anaerolineales bacterium]|nr:winged helix-turn-helix domain-containing protein [Anaerolineales bacterium]
MTRQDRDRRGRLHTSEIIRAAAHPTRQLILKGLRERELSTIDLERQTGENRYNLYHHLGVLVEAGLVEAQLEDGRAKKYRLTRPESAREAFFQFERGEKADPGALARLLEALAEAQGEPIADPQDVQSVTIMLRYSDE